MCNKHLFCKGLRNLKLILLSFRKVNCRIIVNNYHRLNFEDRVKIETLINAKVPISQIAINIGVSRSTVTREIRKVTLYGATQDSSSKTLPTKLVKSIYKATAAQEIYERNKRHGRPSSLTEHKKKVLVHEIAEKHLTPEQVRVRHPNLFSNANIIYSWINQGRIEGLNAKEHLPMRGKRYMRKRNDKNDTEKKIRKYTGGPQQRLAKIHSIKARPESINNRREFGHWEMDGVESSKSSSILITLVERASRFQVGILSKSKKIDDMMEAMYQLKDQYGAYIKSVTSDNGSEFVNSSVTNFIVNEIGADYYVANAYAPYERGTNERTNGNLRARWYFPKGTDFEKVTQKEVNRVILEINQKPLTKVFTNGKSPYDVFTRQKRLIDRRLSKTQQTNQTN